MVAESIPPKTTTARTKLAIIEAESLLIDTALDTERHHPRLERIVAAGFLLVIKQLAHSDTGVDVLNELARGHADV